jgi:hypothetical protein
VQTGNDFGRFSFKTPYFYLIDIDLKFIFMRTVLLPLLILCLLCTSCFEITEDIVLRKDGSGKYSLKMDMSGFFSDPMLKGLMASSEQKEPMKNIDSMVYLKDMPDSLFADNPDLWKRVSLRILANQEKEQLFTTFFLDFKSVDEISYLAKNIDKVMSKAKAGPFDSEKSAEAPPTGFLTEGISYMLEGKELKRTTINPEPKEGGDDMEMMKAFLGSAKYHINMEMPGKVKSVTIPNAKVKGKKVTIEASLLEMMENKLVLDGLVKYK